MKDGSLPMPPTKLKKSEEVRKYPEPGAFSDEKKELVIPERDTDTSELYAYLTDRGISPIVIDYFVDQGSLYQGAKYKNVCFVGYDRQQA